VASNRLTLRVLARREPVCTENFIRVDGSVLCVDSDYLVFG
jgi:hypothetical protein